MRSSLQTRRYQTRDIAEITAAGEKAAAAKLARLQEKLQADGLEAESVQVVGSPVQHITSEAERTEADGREEQQCGER